MTSSGLRGRVRARKVQDFPLVKRSQKSGELHKVFLALNNHGAGQTRHICGGRQCGGHSRPPDPCKPTYCHPITSGWGGFPFSHHFSLAAAAGRDLWPDTWTSPCPSSLCSRAFLPQPCPPIKKWLPHHFARILLLPRDVLNPSLTLSGSLLTTGFLKPRHPPGMASGAKESPL